MNIGRYLRGEDCHVGTARITKTSKMKEFTFEQVMMWRRYEEVRTSGQWNMYFPQAQAATGLSTKDYIFVMENFDDLKKESEKFDNE